MSGWIKIHRQILDHWLLQDDKRFKWWTIMIFEANYKSNKMILGNSLFIVDKGQCALSIRSWAIKFKTGTKSVESFFKLLEKDKMISRKIIGKGKQSTTLITIENYSKYQLLEETQGTTQRKRKEGTTKESKEIKNISNTNVLDERKQIFRETLRPFLNNPYDPNTLKEFFEYWTEPNPSNTKMKFEMQKTWSIERRLKTWGKNEIKFNGNKIVTNDQLREITNEARRLHPNI